MAFPADAYTTPAAEPTWRAELMRLAPDRLLVLLGGVSALLFGALTVLLQALDLVDLRGPAGFTSTGGVVLAFVVSLAFGLALLLAFVTMEQRPAEGAILALAFSVVLLAFGNIPGIIAGILALVGSLVGLLRHVKWTTPAA